MQKFEQKGITIYNADCMDVFPLLDDGCIDFVITDVPYECSKSYISRKNQKDLNSDFGSWDVFFIDWIKEAHRVCKDGGGMVVFVPATRFETLMNACQEAGFSYVQPWFWKKNNPPPVFRNTLQWAVEHMIYVVKGSHKLNIENRGKCPNIFEFPVASGRRKRIHPTQKPVALLEKIVGYCTNVGDLVLDCFHGSGSTGLACVRTGRRYIGIEKNSEYFSKSSIIFREILKEGIFRGREEKI